MSKYVEDLEDLEDILRGQQAEIERLREEVLADDFAAVAKPHKRRGEEFQQEIAALRARLENVIEFLVKNRSGVVNRETLLGELRGEG